MTTTDVLDDIIANLDPEDVPVEYIVMAKITDFEGVPRVIRGIELEEMMRNPELHQIAEARVILNVRKIRKAIISEVNAIYDMVNHMYNSTSPDRD